MEFCDALNQLRKNMPVLFAGTEMDHYTGKGYRWRTFQNEICRGEVPEGIIIKSGKKNLVIRDNFLIYWQKKIDATKQLRGMGQTLVKSKAMELEQ